MVKKLALFDFDGTIYDGDSMRDFARFLNKKRYYAALLLIAVPYLLSLLRLVSTEGVKRTFMRRCFGGKTVAELTASGRSFFEEYHTHLYASARSYIAARREEGIRCVVISASCREWLLPFCEALDVELICTELDYGADDKATGNWCGENMKGKEKVAAIRKRINLSEYEEIHAFGNSRADRKLAAVAHVYHHCYFSR